MTPEDFQAANIEPRGASPRRLESTSSGHLERAYVAVWHEQWPNPHQFLTLLTRVPCGEDESDHRHHFDGSPRPEKQALGKITERDVRLAESLIQWLGSNVGQGLVEDALARGGRTLPEKTDTQHRIEERGRIVAELVRWRDEGVYIQGMSALPMALRIHRAGLDEDGRTWGRAFYECPECGKERPVEFEGDLNDPRPYCEEWSDVDTCPHQFTNGDLRISRKWIDSL